MLGQDIFYKYVDYIRYIRFLWAEENFKTITHAENLSFRNVRVCTCLYHLNTKCGGGQMRISEPLELELQWFKLSDNGCWEGILGHLEE